MNGTSCDDDDGDDDGNGGGPALVALLSLHRLAFFEKPSSSRVGHPTMKQ